MDDGQQLLLRFQAQFERYNRQFERAISQTDRRFKMLENRSQRAARTMESSMARAVSGMNNHLGNVGRNFGAALAGALTIRTAQTFIDGAIRIENALKATGLEGEALKKVYDDLFAAAQRNSAPVESLVTLYSRLALNQRELKTNSGELVRFSETIAMALRAGGTSATEASGALTQLSQALGGGIVRAEEFNSILEGAPTILQAAAAGIKEANGSVAELRRLMLEGKLSSEAFFRGIDAGAPMIAERLQGASRTISASLTNLYNALTDAAGEFNNSSEAANTFGAAIDNLAAYVNTVDFGGLIGEVYAYMDAIAAAIQTTRNFALEISRITGLENVGRFLEGSAAFRAIGGYSTANRRDRINADGYESSPELEAFIRSNYPNAGRSGRVERSAAPAATNFTPTPISIADFPASGTAGAGSGGRKGGSGGGGGRDREAAKAERQAEAVRELIEELEREQSLLGATDAQRAVSDALRRAGAAATEQQKSRIGELVTAIEAEKEALEGAKAAQEELKAVATDVIGGIANGLMQGASAGEILSGVLDKLTAKLLDMATQSLVEKAFGGGGGKGGLFGILGGLFGLASPSAAVGKAIAGGAAGLFAEGGYTGQGGKHEPKGIVHGGEFVMSKAATEKIGVAELEALHQSALRGFSDGGYVGSTPALRPMPVASSAGSSAEQNITLSPTVNVNASGGTPEQNADLARKTSKAVENQMKALVQRELQTALRPGNILGRR